MASVTEREEAGTTRVVSHGTDGASVVVEGRVERITGAGKFVVEPEHSSSDVAVGNRVMILVSETAAIKPAITLGTVKERVEAPIPSDWAVIVGGNTRLERCRVYCGGKQLRALDIDGELKSEVPLAVGETLYFRLPEEMHLEEDSFVEVMDGNASIRRERFGAIGPMVRPAG